MCPATCSAAAAGSGSEPKKFAMSLAIATRRWTFIVAAPSADGDRDALAGGAHRARSLAPGIRLRDLGDLDGGDLVLGAVGRPVRVLRRHEVYARLREVEGRVHDAAGDAPGERSTHDDFAGAARDADQVAVLDAAGLGVVRVHFENVFLVEDEVPGADRKSTRLNSS